MNMNVRLRDIHGLEFERTASDPMTQKLLLDWWRSSSAESEGFFNGDLVGISKMVELTSSMYQFFWYKTNYAHTLQRKAANPVCLPAQTLYCVTRILTADDLIIVGRMGHKTASPGYVFLPGGGMEPPQDGIVTSDYCKLEAVREVQEELGLTLELSKMHLWKMKTNGNIGLIYSAEINLLSHEVKRIFEAHNHQLSVENQFIEFSEVLFLDPFEPFNEECAGYLPIVLRETRRELLQI